MPGITPPACFCARALHSHVTCDAKQAFSRTPRADSGMLVCAYSNLRKRDLRSLPDRGACAMRVQPHSCAHTPNSPR
eukprot:5060987-Prymnesium_polylepis.1